MGVCWSYEPEKYPVDGHDMAYLPDLLLRDVLPVGAQPHCHAEIRPLTNPNHKAIAFGQSMPVLLLTGTPCENQTPLLRFGEVVRSVQFSDSGRLIACGADDGLCGGSAGRKALEAAMASGEYDFEEAHREALTARLGMDPAALVGLSRDALVVLHLINSVLRPPCPMEKVLTAANQLGMAPPLALRGLEELLEAGLLLDKARRYRLQQRFVVPH